jgi:hypothetical protein
MIFTITRLLICHFTTPDVRAKLIKMPLRMMKNLHESDPLGKKRIVTLNKEGDLKVTSPRVLTRSKAHQAGVELKFTRDWAG